MPLTAHDVAFTYNYVIKNQLGNYTMYTNFIKSVVAPDDNTVVFTCTKPKANMLNMWVYIVPEHIWGKISGKAAQGSYQNNPPIVGSGPFQLTQYKKDQYAIMTANKNYWGGAPKIDEVDFAYYQNADTMVQEMKSGTLQGCLGRARRPQYRAAAERPDLQAARLHRPRARRARPSTATRARRWATRCSRTGTSARRCSRRSTTTSWCRSPTAAWPSRRPRCSSRTCGATPTGTGSRRPTRCTRFDLAKAGQMLTAAGYPLKNGVRVDKQGKPIKLRLWTPQRAPTRASRPAS